MNQRNSSSLVTIDSSRSVCNQTKLNSSIDGSISKLPNELLQSILVHLELQLLMHLRLVCTRWRELIERMGHAQRSLILSDSYFQLDQQFLSTRFFGHANFECIQLKQLHCNSSDFLSQFRVLLAKLFPNVQQLVIQSYCLGIFDFVFDLWPTNQITSLLMHGYDLDSNQNGLAARINSLVNLKRLDLGGQFLKLIPLLTPTFVRVRHFSVYRNDCVCDNNQYVSQLVGHLGPNCTHFWLTDNCLRFVDVARCHVINPEWMSNLTKLGLKIRDGQDEVVRYLSEFAPSLQSLHLDSTDPIKLTPEMIFQLGRMSQLTELVIEQTRIDFASLEKAADNFRLVPIETVSTCTLRIKHILGPVNGFRFARVLSIILPNIQKLTIQYKRILNLADIDQHWKCFPRLRECQLKEFV